jgi:hypothetical protein
MRIPAWEIVWLAGRCSGSAGLRFGHNLARVPEHPAPILAGAAVAHSGSWAVDELTEGGLNVVLFEAGRHPDIVL